MQLSDLFEQLIQGELSQLQLSGRDSVGILQSDYVKVIPHINLALTELYKRFNLRTAEVVIQQYDHIQTYYLDKLYAQTNVDSDKPTKYIMDSPYQPFTDNVLIIDKIYNELGEELYKNQDRSFFPGSDKYWSVNTPSYNSIQVPYPDNENQMIVTYRADHDPIIITEDTQLKDVHIPISPSYLEPLLLYIAARVYTNLSSNEGNEGNIYTQKFEASVKKIEELNLNVTEDTHNTRLDENGWI